MSELGKNLEVRETRSFDIQRRVVAHMTETAWKTIPHVAATYEPDVTKFMNAFNAHRNDFATFSVPVPKLSINTVLLKIIAEGLKAAPELNALVKYHSSSVHGDGMIMEKVNIAIPYLLPDGRDITPVIPDLGNKSLYEVGLYMDDLRRRISNTNIDELLYETGFRETIAELKKFHLGRLRRVIPGFFGRHKIKRLKGEEKKNYYAISEKDRLTPDDLFNASFLVSNIGSALPEFRGHINLLEIIPPHAMVIGISPVQKKPGFILNSSGKEELASCQYLPFCVAFDHRWLDFAHLIPFFKKVDGIINNPEQFFIDQLKYSKSRQS